MKKFSDAFRSLLQLNMAVTPGERIVVFSDVIREDESPSPREADRRTRLLATAEQLAAYASRHFGNTGFVSFPTTAASGAEPPEVLWRAVLGDETVALLQAENVLAKLLHKKADESAWATARDVILSRRDDVARVVVALSNNSTSHTRFRALVNLAGGRYASLPHFEPEMFLGSMQVDWKLLSAKTQSLADLVNRADTVRVSCPNGTFMIFRRAGRTAKADDGLLTAPGAFGNLPAGEVYFAPVEGASQGMMVLEYAPTAKLRAPLRLTVSDGIVTAIEGSDPYREKLEQKFSENSLNRNIAELGIGTNEKASCPDNVLEAEKILGTVHIALGDNSGFGGTVSTPFHEDYVFYLPTVTLIDPTGGEETIIVDGNPLFMENRQCG